MQDSMLTLVGGVLQLVVGTSGVAQGGPLSRAILVLPTDPPRPLHTVLVEARAGVRCCVDDMTLLPRAVRFLADVARVLRLAAVAMGIQSEPSTLQIVVLGASSAPEAEQRGVSEELSAIGGGWERVGVAVAGPCLGACLGPMAGAATWTAPLRRFAQRVHELVARAPPATAAAVHHTTTVLPVLAYAASLARAPLELAAIEVHAIVRIFRLLGNSSPLWGRPRLQSAELAAAAHLHRLALSMRLCWERFGLLFRRCRDALPLACDAPDSLSD